MSQEIGPTSKGTKEFWENAYQEALKRREDLTRRLAAPDLTDEERAKLAREYVEAEEGLEAIAEVARMYND